MFTYSFCAQTQGLFVHKSIRHLCTNDLLNCAQTRVAFVHNSETPCCKGFQKAFLILEEKNE